MRQETTRLFGGACAVATLLLVAPASRATSALQQIPSATRSSPEEPELRAVATDGPTRAFYERYGWRLQWSPASAQALEQALAARASHGLNRISFLASADTPAQRDVAQTTAALRYAKVLAEGVMDPASLHSVYTLPRPKPDIAAGLANALGAGRLGEWLGSLAPQDADYARLSQAYRDAEAEQRRETDAPPKIDASGLIRPGDDDARMPSIARQLMAEGYMLAPPSTGGPSAEDIRYTDALAEAVRHLQRDYGLAEDGVIGPNTVEVLNLRAADRARALAVALERLRWLDRVPPTTRIDVNVAAARLYYYRDGQMVDSRKVIVGKPDHETPPLFSPIYRLVANPTWTIPKSIERAELANVGPDYLASHNMVRRGGYIVQRPGPDNALGQVKFDMINDQAIYLHDTSAPSLFDRSQRHLSHGCVRVDDALGFAQRIAEDEGVAERWQEASAGGEQTFVPLPVRIPVRLLYQNAFVDEAEQVTVRTDPYGWNGPIAKALGFDSGNQAHAQADAVDIGP